MAPPEMTLRDYFAGLAMQAMVSGYRREWCAPDPHTDDGQNIDQEFSDCVLMEQEARDHVAELAYQMADAMLGFSQPDADHHHDQGANQ